MKVDVIVEESASFNSPSRGVWGGFQDGTRTAGQYIQYFYGIPRKIEEIQFYQMAGAGNYQLGSNSMDMVFNVQGSNDGINFEKLTEDFSTTCFATNVSGDKNVLHKIDTQKEYSYYRLVFVSGGFNGVLAQNNRVNYYIKDLIFK